MSIKQSERLYVITNIHEACFIKAYGVTPAFDILLSINYNKIKTDLTIKNKLLNHTISDIDLTLDMLEIHYKNIFKLINI